MKITATQQVEAEITDRELGHALHIRARQMYNCDFDDAGCDWLTDGAGNTYVGNATWHASSNPEFAAMIDAANILMYDRRLIVEPLQQTTMFPAGEDGPLFTLPEDTGGPRIKLVYGALSVTTRDLCLRVIAASRTPAECWQRLESMRNAGEIPQTQYDEIEKRADFILAD